MAVSKRRRFLALDQRSGRLERAINLVEDGERPGLMVKRGEDDPPHPLSRPFVIGPDRINLKPMAASKDREATVLAIGYAAKAGALYERIVPVMTTSYLAEVAAGTPHDFEDDLLKLALFTDDADLSIATTAYSTTEEVASGNGYTAGGIEIGQLITYTLTYQDTTTLVEDTDATLTLNTVEGIDGLTSGDTLTAGAGAAANIYRYALVTSTASWTVSAVVKAGTATVAALEAYDGTAYTAAFDLDAGTDHAGSGSTTRTIKHLGDGWYFIR